MNVDVTTDIHRYLGHNGDFSGCNITPRALGYVNLEFKIMKEDGEIKTLNFTENQVIAFDKD